MAKLIEQLKKAVLASNKTRYRLSKESGLDAAQLSRLMDGQRGLSVEAVEKLADALELELVIQPKRRRRSGTAKA